MTIGVYNLAIPAAFIGDKFNKSKSQSFQQAQLIVWHFRGASFDCDE